MNRLTGTGTLTRFALRRDRILLPAWVAVFTTFTVFSTSATVALYPDVASRTQAGRFAGSYWIVSFRGSWKVVPSGPNW